MADDGANIFGSAADSQNKGKDNKEPRIFLKNIDTMQSQLLEPWGVSLAEDISLDSLWAMTKEGNKYAKFHSELAAEDEDGGDYRRGVGLSRYCGLMKTVIQELKTREDLQKCLATNVYEKAMEEAEALLPHFTKLDAGKGSQTKEKDKEESLASLKRRRLNQGDSKKTPTTKEEIKESAQEIFAWLEKGTASNLRMVIAILSAGGIFYNAHVGDKVARSWYKHAIPKVTATMCARILTARHHDKGEPDVSESAFAVEQPTGGLFD